ncbi:unnamed protein product, partial [Rotaria sp. Silwood2]
VTAYNYLTGNELLDFHDYAAATLYFYKISRPIAISIGNRYSIYVNQTGSTLKRQDYGALVAQAATEYAYTAAVTRADLLYPPVTTEAFQSAWKDLAVQTALIYENSVVRSYGFNQPFRSKIIPRVAWLIYLDPNADGLTIIENAVNDTLVWWSSTTEF